MTHAHTGNYILTAFANDILNNDTTAYLKLTASRNVLYVKICKKNELTH